MCKVHPGRREVSARPSVRPSVCRRQKRGEKSYFLHPVLWTLFRRFWLKSVSTKLTVSGGRGVLAAEAPGAHDLPGRVDLWDDPAVDLWLASASNSSQRKGRVWRHGSWAAVIVKRRFSRFYSRKTVTFLVLSTLGESTKGTQMEREIEVSAQKPGDHT